MLLHYNIAIYSYSKLPEGPGPRAIMMTPQIPDVLLSMRSPMGLGPPASARSLKVVGSKSAAILMILYPQRLEPRSIFLSIAIPKVQC